MTNVDKGISLIAVTVIVIIIVIAGIIVLVNANKSYNGVIRLDNDEVTIKNNTATSSNYDAELLDVGDNYCLIIRTKEIDRDIEVTYNYKDYRLDLSNSHTTNTTYRDQGDDRIFTLKNLESNQVYELQFIKMANKKMQLNNNLIIK